MSSRPDFEHLARAFSRLPEEMVAKSAGVGPAQPLDAP